MLCSRVAQLADKENEAAVHVNAAQRSDAGVYSIRVSNEFGADEGTVRVLVLDKPGAPEGPLEVSEVTADSCKLTWKPPADTGGAEVTDYVVEKCEEGSLKWEKVPVSNAGIGAMSKPSCKVQRLEPGKRYEFRVRAQNPYGVSEPLNTLSSILAKNPFGARFDSIRLFYCISALCVVQCTVY